MKKLISHFNQRYNKKPFKFTPAKIDHYVYVKSPKVNEEIGIPVNELQVQLVNNDKLKSYKVRDFSIENLQISGAIDTQKLTSLSLDPLSMSANLTSVAHNIVESNKAN